MEIDYLFDLLKQSNVSLLGYTFKQERLKDEIISKLPHVVITEVDSSFSFKSFLRDLKLQSILETGESVINPEYLVLDLNDIRNLGGRLTQIENIIEKIREDMYSVSEKPPYKLLITTLYNSGKNIDDSDIMNFSGGSHPIYMSELALVMRENSIKVVKNRFGDTNIDISYNKLKYNYEYNN